MKIKEILQNGKLNLSLEVFPPKEWPKFDDTSRTVDSMAVLSPSFISVTYGAAGVCGNGQRRGAESAIRAEQ